MTRRFPNLRVVFEHISTSDAVDFVKVKMKMLLQV